MVAIAYERWSFTRGSNYRAATGKILMFWISGRLWEVIAYELHMEVQGIITLNKLKGFELSNKMSLLSHLYNS